MVATVILSGLSEAIAPEALVGKGESRQVPVMELADEANLQAEEGKLEGKMKIDQVDSSVSFREIEGEIESLVEEVMWGEAVVIKSNTKLEGATGKYI